MKFIKGAVIGGALATGAYIMYSKNECKTRKKIIKFIKNLG